MAGQHERPRIKYQDAQPDADAEPVELLGAVGTVHSGPDDHGVEGEPAIGQARLDLPPVVADEPAQDVVGESCPLDLHPLCGIGRWHQQRQVGRDLRHVVSRGSDT